MGDDELRRVRAAPLTADAWAPFGWLPLDDTDPDDGRHRLRFDWQDPHLNVIAHDAEEVTRVGEALRCEELYRHATHTQALLVLDVRAVVAVAPPATTFERPDDARRIRAFVLDPLDAFVLHPGTWHWGPFPVDEPRVRLFNLQCLGYRDDNERIDLAAIGAPVAVVVA